MAALYALWQALPGQYAGAFMRLLIPAVWVSGTILSKGLREDYAVQVRGRLLEVRDWRGCYAKRASFQKRPRAP